MRPISRQVPVAAAAFLLFIYGCSPAVVPTTASTPEAGLNAIATLTPALSTPTAAPSSPSPVPPAATPVLGASASIELPQLAITAVPVGIPKYDRGDWRHWTDADGDCQSTRHEVLIEESPSGVVFADDGECRVVSGTWQAHFTGTFVVDPTDLDIDHMVPLANAHRFGAWAWSAEAKELYANDLSYPGHLIAVTASANRSKGSRGPEEWRPPDSTYWCQYAVDWVLIKAEWQLSATPEEWDALLEMLATCPYEIVIAGSAPQRPFASPTTAPSSPTIPSNLLYDPFGPDRNCGDFPTWQDAQAFFEAAGGPNSDPHGLDRNRDGIACA